MIGTSDDIGTTDDEESPLAPSIPPFASLRSARRGSAADLLTSGQPMAVQPVAVQPVASSSRPGAARPPEWVDLWHLGLRVVRWWVQQPVTAVRRLIG
jgi:hypothetical protein